MDEPFLILGHRRGATNFAASLMEQFGYEVGHEEWLKDGMVTSMSMRGHVRFPPCRLIHLTRHPLHTVSSLVARDPDLSHYHWENTRAVFGWGGGGLHERAARSYISWHKLILAMMPDVRVQAETMKKDMTEELGTEPGSSPPIRYNRLDHRQHTREELADLINASTADELWDLSAQLGYEP